MTIGILLDTPVRHPSSIGQLVSVTGWEGPDRNRRDPHGPRLSKRASTGSPAPRPRWKTPSRPRHVVLVLLGRSLDASRSEERHRGHRATTHPSCNAVTSRSAAIRASVILGPSGFSASGAGFSRGPAGGSWLRFRGNRPSRPRFSEERRTRHSPQHTQRLEIVFRTCIRRAGSERSALPTLLTSSRPVSHTLTDRLGAES